MEWSDLRVFLAVARERSLGGAGRRLGQSQPTMGRRIRALEEAVGQILFQRTKDGFVLTDEGARVLVHAERMEEEAQALQRELTGNDGLLEGMLRISSSDWFGIHMLVPILAEFAQKQPKVVVELLTDSRFFSLPRREADLVFRIQPFDDPEIISRRLIHIDYAAYIAIGSSPPTPRDGEGTALVIMDTALEDTPDAIWIRRILPKAHIGARSNNRDVQAQLCVRGAGVAMLPIPLGDAIPGLQRIDLRETPPGRDTWVGYHRDLKRLSRLRALLNLVIERLAK
jgi:DNA-binding transcriptional LysR family regulator